MSYCPKGTVNIFIIIQIRHLEQTRKMFLFTYPPLPYLFSYYVSPDLFPHFNTNVHVLLSVRCQNRKLYTHWTTCAAFVLLRHESVTRLCVHRAESHCPQVPGCETVENTKVYFASSLRVKSMGSGRPERIQRIYPAQSRWHDKLGQYRFVNAQLRCLIRVIMIIIVYIIYCTCISII